MRCSHCGCEYPIGHDEVCFLNPDNIVKCMGCRTLMREDTINNERVDPDTLYHSIECEEKGIPNDRIPELLL